MGVEDLREMRATEALDVRVLIGLAPFDVMDGRAVGHERLGRTLGTVVGPDRLRRAVHQGERRGDLRNATTRERRSDDDVERFAIAFIDDGQRGDPPPVIQGVAHQLHRPRLIQRARRLQRQSHPLRHTSHCASRQVEAQCAVYAMHALVIPRLGSLRAEVPCEPL